MSSGIVPLILHLGSRKWSHIYAPATFPPGKNPGYTLNRELGLDILQKRRICFISLGFVKPFKATGYVMHRQFNIQQLYVLPTLYLCVLYLSENEERLVPLTA